MRNKIFFLIVSLLLGLSLTLFFVTFSIEKSTINELATEQLNKKIEEKNAYFEDYIQDKKRLLFSLSVDKNFIDFIKMAEGKSYVENTFISYAISNSDIFQFRYIDKNGDEVIRVDNYKDVKLIKKQNLQNKKSRYYFEDTMKLNKYEFFFSNIDLNVEHGKIEKPIVPTLRIATPVIIDDIKYGIVIININLKEFLSKLQDSDLHYVNLIYDDGQVIVSKDSKYNWSRDYNLGFTLNSIFPNLSKDFNKSNLVQNSDYYVKKLDINTKNEVFMVLEAKKLELYDLLYEDGIQSFKYIILILVLTIPLSYFVSNYIENAYQRRISMEDELSKLRVAIEHSPISVVITNKHAHIEYVNRNFMKVTGYSANEVLGKNPNILKSDMTSSDEYQDLWNTLLSKKTWKGTFKNIRKDGSEFWENAIITPIFDDENNTTNYLAIKEEITKEVYLEEELKKKDKLMIAQSRHAAMGEMISMIAHQWRQPLNNISILASSTLIDIELDNLKAEQLKEHSESIIKQVQYLSNTIEDFRDFFKPNKQRESVYPKAILEEALKMLNKTLENSDVSVELFIESNTKVDVYSRELLQVLINLIKNAKEALVINNIEEKRIEVKIFDKNDDICIEVSDNAGGVEDILMDKIFEPYFSTKDEKTGTGLGLYMSKTIVEKHLKGRLGVYNKQQGACFYIELPAL